MISRIKGKIRDFLRWQVTVGAKSEEVLAELHGLNSELAILKTEAAARSEEVHAELCGLSSGLTFLETELATVRARFEQAARLQSSAMEVTSEIIENWRREIAFNRESLQRCAEDVKDSMGVLESISGAVSHLRDRPAFRPYAYLGNHLGLATTDAGFRIFVDTRDRQLAPHLTTVGIWEPWNVALLRALLKPGDTIVEVGANFGFFTILGAVIVGNAGRVIAFEANPSLVRLLSASVDINGLADRVDIRALAATDFTGEAEFAVYENHLGDGHISAIHAARHTGQSQLHVPADTLDNQLQRVADVRLLRLDAEGAEPAILRGAANLIARSPRLVILMEWGLATAGMTAELEALTAEGFGFHIVQHDGSLREVSIDALAAAALCDVVCYRGDATDLAVGTK